MVRNLYLSFRLPPRSLRPTPERQREDLLLENDRGMEIEEEEEEKSNRLSGRRRG